MGNPFQNELNFRKMKKFKSTETEDFAPNLPEELIHEVLTRLPARSIGRFRCVSKPWRSLLSSPKFARSHLDFHRRSAAPVVVLPVDELEFQRTAQRPHLLTFPADGGDSRSRKVICPCFRDYHWMTVEAACHGFVLVVLDKADRYVLNPVTLESFELPEFDLSLDYADGMYGMGYDSSSDDYKIVQLSYYEPDSSDDSDSGSLDEYNGTFADVYSMKMKCWRRVAKSPYEHYLPDSESAGEYPGVFTDGFLHWVAIDSEGGGYVISAFSLDREVFEEVPLPRGFHADSHIKHLAVLRGCFAIVCHSSNGCTDVWLMKEYGVQESWEKLVIDTQGRDLTISAVLSLSREDEFVLVELLNSYLVKLIAYNLVTGIWRDVVVDGILDEFDHRVVTFTECLLSPNHISD